MTCREVRELMYAFLDNELDGPLSIEVQRHLDQCAPCAQEAEVERTIRKRMEAAMVAGMPQTPPFDEAQMLKMLASSARLPPRRPRRWRLFASAACVAVLLVAGIIVWTVHREKTSPIANLISSGLIVDDFEEFVNKGRPVQIASGDAAEVTAWIGRETKMPVELAVMHGRCKLLGARKCSLSGRNAALVLYEADSKPASVLVLARRQGDLRGMKDLDAGHRVDQCKDHTIVACERGDLIYAAVGKLPEKELLDLLPDAQRQER